jgi:Fe-S-cluster containining protein
MGLTLKELFEKHLAVDWWEEGSEFDHNVFVLAPRLAGEDAGTEYPGDPQGRCALLTSGDDRCSIHTLGKPHECRVYHHAMPRQEGKDLHLATAKLWDNPEAQKQIVELLGREPEASYYEPASIYERFGMFR